MRADSSGGGADMGAIWQHSLVFSNGGSNIGGSAAHGWAREWVWWAIRGWPPRFVTLVY